MHVEVCRTSSATVRNSESALPSLKSRHLEYFNCINSYFPLMHISPTQTCGNTMCLIFKNKLKSELWKSSNPGVWRRCLTSSSKRTHVDETAMFAKQRETFFLAVCVCDNCVSCPPYVVRKELLRPQVGVSKSLRVWCWSFSFAGGTIISASREQLGCECTLEKASK